MISVLEVERQLKRIGVSFRFWGKAELRELPKILLEGEQIKGCINGRYEGGFAMLCATDQRLLLIDKKPLFLTVTDLRYDMISEVDYGYRLLDASIQVCTPNKTFSFEAWRQKELRDIAVYVQQRVIELRQHHTSQPQMAGEMNLLQPQPAATASMTPLPVGQAQPVAASGTLGGVTLPQRYAANPYTKAPITSRSRVAKFGGFLMTKR